MQRGARERPGRNGARYYAGEPKPSLTNSFGQGEERQMKQLLNQAGDSGWMVLLWLVGIPVPVILLLYLLRGCN